MEPTRRWMAVLHSPVLPASAVQAAFDDALTLVTQTRDDELLTMLCEHADLPDACLERLADVLTADPCWHRPVQAALSRTCVPAALLRAATAQLDAGVMAFAGPLRQHPAALTPEQAALVLAQPLLTHVPGKLSRLLARCGPVLAVQTVVPNSRTDVLLYQLVKFDVPVQDLVDLIMASSEPGRLLDAMWEYRPHLQGEQIADMVRATRQAAGRTFAWEPHEPPPVSYTLLEWDLSPARFDVPSARRPDCELVAGCASEELGKALACATALLGRRATAREDLIATGMMFALRNPALSELDRAQLVQFLLDPDVDSRTWECLDVVTWCPSMATEWALAHPVDVLTRHGWDPFGGREAAHLVLPVMCERTAHCKRGATGMTEFFTALVELGLDELVLTGFPVPMLDRLSLHVSDSVHAVASYQVGTYLDAHLHTPAHWSAFAGMWPQFTGTLGELMDVCTALSVR